MLVKKTRSLEAVVQWLGAAGLQALGPLYFIRTFAVVLLATALICEGQGKVSAALTRDTTDTKFLALCSESHAKYLVTQDRAEVEHEPW